MYVHSSLYCTYLVEGTSREHVSCTSLYTLQSRSRHGRHQVSVDMPHADAMNAAVSDLGVREPRLTHAIPCAGR